MDSAATMRMERMNYVFGVMLIVGAAFLGSHEQLIGMAAGVTISCVNFSILRRLVARVLSSGDGRNAAAILFLPQMVGLMAAVALAMFFLPASAAFIAIGFSVFMLSIGVETARFLMSPVIGPTTR